MFEKGEILVIEKIIFNLLAFSLFIVIFFKIIRRNDSNYVFLLLLEAVGIGISFYEISLGIEGTIGWCVLRYCLSVLIPLFILILEFRGLNFSELISVILAKFFIMIGDNKAAKNILIKLTEKYPNSYLGHKILAEIYEKEGGMRKAIDEYVSAIDLRDNDYKSYFKIAELLKELGKKDEAIEMLDNLLKNKPDCYEASILLGELLCEKERFKEAANVYQEALKYAPYDFDLYYSLGIVYTRLSDFQLAKEMYEKAAEINHRLFAANYNLGLIALMQQDLEGAEKYFQESLYEELEPWAYYQLAKVYILKGEKDKAINFLNKAIELAPLLLKRASNEKAFEKIKEYITVSARMDEKDEEEKEIDDEEQEEKESVMEVQTIIAREYLEEVTSFIEDMCEKDSKAKIEEKVNYIFNRERLKREKEQEEKIMAEKARLEELLNLDKELQDRQKQLGTN